MNSTRLKYLPDTPINVSTKDNEEIQDRFNHTGYSRSLKRLCQECPTPFCIGLFGGWGTGKTGIVKGLLKEVPEGKDGIRFLYFDVWKHSADSLRRQLLIEIDKAWFDGEKNFENRLYVNTVKTTDFKTSISWKVIKKHLWWVLLLVLLILLLALVQTPAGFSEKNWVEVIGTAILPLIALLIASVQGEGFTNSEVTDVSKPTSPEEFEKLFKEALQLSKGVRNVFILDNLDRVEDGKVFEVLTGISTFLGESNCIYIIPCDEERLKVHLTRVLAFQGNDENSDHADDFLRKLFNAQISLRPVVEGQLVEYINSLIKQIGVDQGENADALQVILLAGLSKNPRRVKQFLNNFVASYNLAQDIENQEENEASLPKGFISGNMGFLAKVLFIRNVFNEAYLHFEKHAGSFTEVEKLIKTRQLKPSSKGDSTLERLLELSVDAYSLESFLRATIHVSSLSPEVFFKFSGNADLAVIESIEEIQNTLLRNEPQTALDLIEMKMSDTEFVSDLTSHILERLRSKSVGRLAKLNALSAIIKLVTVKNPLNEKILKFSGNIITRVPEDLFSKAATAIDPIIWTIARNEVINVQKTQSIARLICAELDDISKDLPNTIDGMSGFDLKKKWDQLSPHLMAMSHNWILFENTIQGHLRGILLRLLEAEVLNKSEPVEGLWNWIMPEDSQFPEIVKNSEFLEKFGSKVPKGNTEQVRRTGLLISKLHQYSGNKVFYPLLENLSETFDKEYEGRNKELYPLNIAKEWILNCNKLFDSRDVDTIYKAVTKNQNIANSTGYDVQSEWFEPFIQLYMRAEDKPVLKSTKTSLQNLITAEIRRKPERYIELFRKNKFELDSTLNYYALQAFGATVNDLGNYEEDLKEVIEVFIMEISEADGESIRNSVLEDFWSIKEEYGHWLSIRINNKLRELYSQIKNTSEIIRVGLIYAEDPTFWAQQNQCDVFFDPIWQILEQDKRLKSTDRDNLVEPFLKKITLINDDGFKKKFGGFRQRLFAQLSSNSKKRTLNQIWTLFPKLTDVAPGNPDLTFLMENIEHCKEADKKEILVELLEQLTSGSENGRLLFQRFGGRGEVIKTNPILWVEELATHLTQENNDPSAFNEMVEKNLDLLPESEKKEILRGILG